MDIVVILLLTMGFTMILLSWFRQSLRCPNPKVVYKFIPKHTLDVQFGNENNPSKIFSDMFEKSTPWIGGYDMGSGKTYEKT